MALLAGHAQLCWYMLLFTVVWTQVLAWQEKSKKQHWVYLAAFGGAVLVGVAISAVQIIPTAELLFLSQRAQSVSFDGGLTYSFWPWRLITLFAPDFFGNPGFGDFGGYGTFWEDAAYIGVIPVFLALSTFGRLVWMKPFKVFGKEKKNILVLWVMIGIGILFALGKNTPVFIFLYKYVPTFNMFNSPARFLIWVHMSLCILAAIGSEHWGTPTGKGLYWLRLGTAGGFSVLLTAILVAVFFPALRASYLRSSIIFGVFAISAGILTLIRSYTVKKKVEHWWKVLCLAIVFVDLYLAGAMINPTLSAKQFDSKDAQAAASPAERIFLEPAAEYSLKFSKFLRFTDYRAIADPAEILAGDLPNTNLLHQTSLVNNFDPLQPEQFTQLMEALPDMNEPEKTNWLRLMNVSQAASLELTEFGRASNG